jgi:hypothetical protein
MTLRLPMPSLTSILAAGHLLDVPGVLGDNLGTPRPPPACSHSRMRTNSAVTALRPYFLSRLPPIWSPRQADPILSPPASSTRISAARTGQVIEHARETPRNRRWDQVRDQDRIRLGFHEPARHHRRLMLMCIEAATALPS